MIGNQTVGTYCFSYMLESKPAFGKNVTLNGSLVFQFICLSSSSLKHKHLPYINVKLKRFSKHTKQN